MEIHSLLDVSFLMSHPHSIGSKWKERKRDRRIKSLNQYCQSVSKHNRQQRNTTHSWVQYHPLHDNQRNHHSRECKLMKEVEKLNMFYWVKTQTCSFRNYDTNLINSGNLVVGRAPTFQSYWWIIGYTKMQFLGLSQNEFINTS